jgi:hypothetical protein
MFGGVAIFARCPGIASNSRLQRANADLDFVAAANDWERVGELFTARGYTKQSETAREQHFVKDDVTVEVSHPRLREDYDLDVSDRLSVTPLTLPLVDLLLIKLARVNFRVQDIQDAAALLVDHRVTGDGDETEEINRNRLYQVTNHHYRLWKTVFDNTVTLEKTFDRYLEPEQAQLAWRRTELLQEVLDGKDHSIGWWAGRILTP